MRQTVFLVPDDDPDWLRFWAVYPLRVSKKDARKAWAQLSPSSELIARILEALAWQVPMWASQSYGIPYPGTYIRTERWEDERPMVTVPVSRRADTRPAWLREAKEVQG